MDKSPKRKLAAIMFTDIVGYTDLMGKNESEAFKLINTQRDLMKPIINSFNGTWIKEVGDGTISSFNSAFEAANCGLEIQRILRYNPNLTIRIGIHIGDIIEKDGDIFGDGVNIASRLESNADPGGICISDRVYEDIKNKPEIKTSIIGEKQLKGVERSVVTYKILIEEISTENNNTNADIIEVKNNNLVKALFAFVVIGVFCFYFYYNNIIILNQSNTENPKSIAVLLFDNFSPNPDDEYLSSGFTEVIIANLAKINDLMVISRTSVMRYKDKDMNLKEIAEELGVANILEGSIQRTGSKIRVVAQLIEAETDQHIWAETYDEEFEDIFSIQTSIAKEIASALKSQITESEKSVIEEKITDNTDAYEYYLRVKELRSRKRYSTGNKDLRLSLLEKIIKLDPNFAEAFALLSIEHSEMVHFGFDKSQITIDLAKENIENAYSIKPGSPDVQFAFGYYYYGCQKNYLKALEHYKNALAKEPGNAKYMSYIGYAHRRYGNWDEHLKYLEEALVINPNDIDLHANLFSSYYFLRKYNKVNLTDYHAKWYRISPDDPNLYRRRAQWTFRLEGKTDNAREIIDKASTFISDKDFFTITLRSFDYYDHKFDRLIKSYENESDSIKYFYSFIGVKFEEIAFIYWLMDDKDKAYKEAQKALKVYLELADLDEDARYHAALSWVYALLDKPQKAIQEAKMAMEFYPHAKDAFSSDQYEMTLASVYVLIGEHIKALDIIEKQLVGPSGTNWWDIKYDNLFNKVFGNNPRFISIIKKDEDRFRRESTYDLNIFMP